MKKLFSAIILSLILILSSVAVSAARLPIVGNDSNNWGTLLNEYLLVTHTQNGTLNSSLSPTFNGLTLNDRLIMDNPGPTFNGSDSRQTIQADANFSDYIGSSYGAGVMGNALGTLNAGASNSIIAGLIGKYNINNTGGNAGPKGAVIGEVGEDATGNKSNGAFIAVLGGTDPDSGIMTPEAAYTVRYLNINPNSKFHYGLDLQGTQISGHEPVKYVTADIRLSNGATIVNSDSSTLTITEGTIVMAGDLTLNSGVILGGSPLIFEGATANAFETTIAVTDPGADVTITFPATTGNVVTTGDSGTVTSAMIAADTIDDADIVDDGLDASSLAAGSVGTSEILDGTIADADTNGALTGASLAADTLTAADLAENSVTSSELSDNAVDSAAIAANAVITAKIADSAVTTAKINDLAVTDAKINDMAATKISGTITDAQVSDTLTISGGVFGSNSISGTLTTTATLTIGDGGDKIDINSDTWDVTNGNISGKSLTLTDRLIIDNPGPTLIGAGSKQTVQADAIFDGFTGTYGAGVMGNAVSGTIGNDATTGAKNANSIIGGIIGKYNLVNSYPSDHPQGAVIGEIGESVGTTTLPDGAFIAILGGDTAEVDAGAAYTIRYLNSIAGSKFDYGLDLSGAAIDSYQPVTYGKADIKLTKSTSDPSTCDATTEGSIYYKKGGSGTLGQYFGCRQAANDTFAWVALSTD